MKIGVLAPMFPPDPSGIAHTVWYKYGWLTSKGIDAKIISFYPEYFPRETDTSGLIDSPNVVYYRPYRKKGRKEIFYNAIDAVRLCMLINSQFADRDIIEIHGWTLLNLALFLSRHRLGQGKKYIMVYRGNDGWRYQPKKMLDFRKKFNAFAYTMTNSRCMADHISKKGIRVDNTVWSEVDPELFLPAAHHPRDSNTFVTVKNLFPVGGVPALVEALGILAAQGISFRQTIAGVGDLEAELNKKCKDLRIDGMVDFLGHIDHKELPAVMSSASINILTSRLESCPHVLCEAMMMGLPSVVTASPGAQELIEKSNGGLIAHVDDPQDIADKIHHLCTDPSLRTELGRNAHAFAMKNLTPDRVFGQYLDIYQSLLAQ